MKFETKTIHAGIKPDPSTGAIMTPIFQTSTYVQEAPGKHKGYEYGRTKNPTRTALENNLAALESAKYGICFGSGLAATDSIMKLFKSGDEVISTNDLYGGTYRLLTKVYGENYGIKSSFIDLTNLKELEAAITKNTRMIWVETPTNPMLKIIDIEAVCSIAKKHNILVCVDNTFASPYLQRPIELGADLVLHSATKYLGGHSDVIHGAVVTQNDDLAERLYFIQNAAGSIPGPMDCFLILRGIKTLHLRVQRSCENARNIAQFLLTQDKVANVYYPGIKSHNGHKIARKQMKNFGGMVSFDLKKDSLENASKILSNTHLFSLAESLGGVESLIGHPATMTHASIPKKDRTKIGLTDSLIRLSVGVEAADDLIEDLNVAFSHL